MGLFLFGILFGAGLWVIGTIGKWLHRGDDAEADYQAHLLTLQEYDRIDAEYAKTIKDIEDGRYG